MSKIKLLLEGLVDVVSDLRLLAGSLESLASIICESESLPKESTPQLPDPKSQRKTQTVKALTLEDVRSVLSEKSANGHGAEIRELLQKYGHSKLSEIDPKDYPALLADAEVL